MAEAAVQSTGAGQKAGRAAMRDQEVVLERPFGWGGVFIFALCGIGLTYSGLIPFSTIAGLWPGANLVGVLSVAALVALVHAYTYAAIGAVVRRNGADYILASRVLNRPLAFASSWTLVVFLALAGGSIIGSILQNTLPMFARILSLVFDNHLLTGYLDTISSQSGVVLFGSFGVLITFVLLVIPSRVTRYFLLVGLVLALAVWLVMVLQLANSSGPAFHQAWEQAMGSGSFLGDLAQARRLGMDSISGFGPTALAGLAAGLTLFFGYFHATNFSQEVKDPQRNLLRGSWSALLVAWAVLALSAVFVHRLIPGEWLAAQAYLARTAEFEKTAMPWLPYYAMLVNPNPLLFWMLAAAWIVPSLALVYTYLYAGSRVIKAWTDDGLLPPAANFVHPVLRSPLIAVLMVSILAEVGLVFAAMDGQILARINPVFFIACVQVLPVLALIMLPFRKKEWFDQAPLALRRKIGSLPVVSLVGSFSLLYLVGTIVSMLLFPSLQAINQGTIVLFVLLFGSGLVWFFMQQSNNPAPKETQADWPAELSER